VIRLNPSLKRITASDTLNHPFFWSEGGTCQPDSLPRISYRIEAAHEYETQQKRSEEISRRHPPPQAQPPHHKGAGRGGHGGPPGAGGGTNAPAGGRGRSKYRVVTRPSAPSAIAATAATVTEGESSTATGPPPPPQLVPAVAPTNASGSDDMIVPEHQSAFRKLES
jgi:hypothetical protein